METMIIIIISLNCELKSSECDLTEYLIEGPVPEEIKLRPVDPFIPNKNGLKNEQY